ncbi:hypothetical protein C8J57DRAFT_1249758 [Mycena rebaudengoi]|nr:hypothetical protein C8J57DRAFT_1249758 [Mycena rebaudengoi]
MTPTCQNTQPLINLALFEPANQLRKGSGGGPDVAGGHRRCGHVWIRGDMLLWTARPHRIDTCRTDSVDLTSAQLVSHDPHRSAYVRNAVWTGPRNAWYLDEQQNGFEI